MADPKITVELDGKCDGCGKPASRALVLSLSRWPGVPDESGAVPLQSRIDQMTDALGFGHKRCGY